MRKPLAFVAFAMVAASLTTVPAPAGDCGNDGQMWASIGQKQAVTPVPVPNLSYPPATGNATVDGVARGVVDTFNTVPTDFPNGVAGEVTGRSNTGAYGCDIEEGIVLAEERNTYIPDPVGQNVYQPEVNTGPIDDEIRTNFIPPRATHFTWWVRMERVCGPCPIPKEAYWYWDDNSSGTWKLGGSVLVRCTVRPDDSIVQNPSCWAPDRNHRDQFRMGMPAAIPTGTYRLLLSAKITDETTDAFDDFKLVTRQYARCQVWDPKDTGTPAGNQNVCMNQLG